MATNHHLASRKDAITSSLSTNRFNLLDDDCNDISPKKMRSSGIDVQDFRQDFKSVSYKKKRFNAFDNIDNEPAVPKQKQENKLVELDISTILETKLNNKYNLLVHYNLDKNWDYNTYYSVKQMDSWNSLFSSLHTFRDKQGVVNYSDFNTYIMKEDI